MFQMGSKGTTCKNSVKTSETAKAARPKVAEIVFSIQENRLSRSCQMPQTSYTGQERTSKTLKIGRELTLWSGEIFRDDCGLQKRCSADSEQTTTRALPPLRSLSSEICLRHPATLRLSRRPTPSLRRRLARLSRDQARPQRRPRRTALSQSFC